MKSESSMHINNIVLDIWCALCLYLKSANIASHEMKCFDGIRFISGALECLLTGQCLTFNSILPVLSSFTHYIRAICIHNTHQHNAVFLLLFKLLPHESALPRSFTPLTQCLWTLHFLNISFFRSFFLTSASFMFFYFYSNSSSIMIISPAFQKWCYYKLWVLFWMYYCFCHHYQSLWKISRRNIVSLI